MAHDRAIGALCVAVAAVAVATALVLDASTPPPALRVATDDALGPVDDPDTTAAFLEYHRRAERGAWALEASWERRRGDEVRLETVWRSVQDGTGSKVTAAFGNLRGVYAGRVIACGRIGDEQVVCDGGPAPDPKGRFEESAAITRELTAPETGTYTVARAPARTVLDESTECFVLRRRPGHAGWVFGAETTFCYTESGVPVLVERREAGLVDTRTATAVSHEIDDEDFEALLAPHADALAGFDLRSAP